MVHRMKHGSLNVADIGNRLADIVDSAVYGEADWSEFSNSLAGAYPGSIAVFQTMNFAQHHLNFCEFTDLDTNDLQAYEEYYAALNPWRHIWTTARSGAIGVSEQLSPIRLAKHTEFYNDWLRHFQVDAATNMKISAGSGEIVQLMLHYPLGLAPVYDQSVRVIFERLRGNLNRAVALAQSMRASTESAVSAAALMLRSCLPAFLLRDRNRVVAANTHAADLFSQNTGFKVRNDRLDLASDASNLELQKTVERLCRHQQTDVSSIAFATQTNHWRLTLCAVPSEPSGGPLAALLPARRSVLVIATDVSAPMAARFEAPSAKALFGLTRAEIDLCDRLFAGETLEQAAQNLLVAKETVRTRLKSIFLKTRTSRQAELVLLLSRLT